MSNQTVNTKKDINVDHIVFDDIIMIQNDQFALAKMWYKPSLKSMHSVFYQTGTLEMVNFDEKTNDFTLELNQEDQNILDQIDKASIKYIKETGLIQRLSLKKNEVKYRTIVNDTKNKLDEPIKSIKLKSTPNTKFYSNGIKKTRTLSETQQFLIDGIGVKVIIEFDGVVIDIKKNLIITSIILHQFKINKIVPKRLELVEYSFIDSDNEDENDKDNNDDNNSSDKNMFHTVQSTDVVENDNVPEEDSSNDIDETNEVDDIEHVHHANNTENEDDEESNDMESEDNEENSYDEESSDIDVEEFVSKLKQTQPQKQTLSKIKETPKSQLVKQTESQIPEKPKRGRPSKNK